MTVTPAEFERHLIAIQQNQLTVLTISELAALRQEGSLVPDRRYIAITFDDGFSDFYENALPLLKNYGSTATLYLVAGLMGTQSSWLRERSASLLPLMTWDQASRCAEAGVEIGGHTVRHLRLDQLKQSILEHEIRSCKTAIEAHVGIKTKSFAYPFGLHNTRVRQAVAAAGYETACAVGYRLSRCGEDLFCLPRVYADSSFNERTFELLANGRFPLFPAAIDRARHRLWRAARAAVFYPMSFSHE
ncbi:polysaccharide deacetylase family protein [Methylobacterium sp. P31]